MKSEYRWEKDWLQWAGFVIIMSAKELIAMICPYCDSWLREVPDNRCCPNCGAMLEVYMQDEIPEESRRLEPPLGIYKGHDCFLEIGKNSVRIRTEKVAFTKITDYEIRFDELTGVIYQPAENESYGYLCLRCKMNEKTPYISDWTDGNSDPTTAVFKKGANAAFAKVYAFLQSCIGEVYHKPTVKEIGFPEPPVGVYKWAGGSLEFTEDAVCFVRELSRTHRTEYRVLYRDLFAVEAKPPSFWKKGIFYVRCWQNRRMGFGKGTWDHEMLAALESCDEKAFPRIYEFLKECTRIANEAREKSE